MDIKNLKLKLEKFYCSRNFIWAIFAVGIFLRVRQYAGNRSLWVDEASLAISFVTLSFSQLFSPLLYGQMAPFGFLMAEKSAVHLFGPSEYALRLFPLAAGILALFLFYRLAVEFLESKAVPLALGMFAILEPLIYYSSDVKQYSFEVCVAVAVLLLAVRMMKTPQMKPADVLAFGLFGALMFWFSFSVIFVFAAVVLVLGVQAYQKDRKLPASLISVFVMWAVSFIVCYLFSKRYLLPSIQDHLMDFWNDGFMPPLFTLKWFKWCVRMFFNAFEFPGGFTQAGLAGLAFWAGIVSYATQKKESVLGLLALPIVLVFIAAGLHIYPFADRLILFLVPSFLILMAEGVMKIKQSLDRHHGFLGLCFVVMLLVHPLTLAATYAAAPFKREESRPVFKYFKKHYQPGDAVYVYTGAKKAFKYYSLINDFEPDYVVGINSRENTQAYLPELAQFRGKPRVWFFFTHIWESDVVNERFFILNYLDGIGRRVDQYENHAESMVGLKSTDSGVYLYDLR